MTTLNMSCSTNRLSQDSTIRAKNSSISPTSVNKTISGQVNSSNDEEVIDRVAISDQLALILNEKLQGDSKGAQANKGGCEPIVTRNTMLVAEIQLLMERVSRLELKEDYREKEEIKQNVVIRGLEPGNKSKRGIEDIILEKLGGTSTVIQVRKYGNQQREIHVARLSSKRSEL